MPSDLTGESNLILNTPRDSGPVWKIPIEVSLDHLGGNEAMAPCSLKSVTLIKET